LPGRCFFRHSLGFALYLCDRFGFASFPSADIRQSFRLMLLTGRRASTVPALKVIDLGRPAFNQSRKSVVRENLKMAAAGTRDIPSRFSAGVPARKTFYDEAR
jgi:hypothetical protein